MADVPLVRLSLLVLLASARSTSAFSAGKGFGAPPPPASSSSGNGAFASFDRFRAARPADPGAVRRFDPSLIPVDGGGEGDDDVWVAVYRSANNLPSVFVRDAFFDAMRSSTTTAPGGDSETLVSPSPSAGGSGSSSSGVISNAHGSSGDDERPVAVARLARDADSGAYVLDSMRCALKKENLDEDCDGGSEYVEAIGVCVDELVLSYLERCLEGGSKCEMTFDGGILFRGTLFSGNLLSSRGFREATSLSSVMHSHESDYDGALGKYAARAASKDVAKNPGARDRALRIVGCLGRLDREEDLRRATARRRGDAGGVVEEREEEEERDEGEGEESDFDPWGPVKRYL